MTAFEISAAYVLDLLFGDPPHYPHPVRLIGKTISLLEKRFLQWAHTPRMQRFLGIILALTIVSGTGILTWSFIRMAGWVHPVISSVITIFFAYTTLATRNLCDEPRKVIRALEQGDLDLARKEVGFLVSRDTDHLNEEEICRALIETVSENTSDGIVAPLFYLVVGGPPFAMAYKALNTLDSMVGYRNDRYRYLGWASARGDDVANLIPSRLTALLFVISSFILRKSSGGAWRMTWRDGRKNPSPNSGYPEAAMAGALGVQLGGKNFYFGRAEEKPLIGEPKRSIDRRVAKESLHLLIVNSLIAVTIAILIIV
ncbi:MAG TPA: adenosylcobinamide-phosphate synthase CbiB [Thermodesulfobacteriota bacterium]|nr:adenosylcobinamide-phosphate synthase CbiB [Thermodesulfobacteriota bacterium]